MTDKTTAQAARSKLQSQFPFLSLGLGKDGDDWTVEVRSSNGLTVSLPTSVDGVKIRFQATGPIVAL